MTALTADDMQSWHISYFDGRPPESIQAAYPAGDDSLPGWVALKDWQHKTVAMVPGGAAALIRRCPNDPATVDGLVARLVGDVRATACLPRHLEGDTDGVAAKNEVALRTQVIKALMRDRVSDAGDGGGEFYAYLRNGESGAQPGEILDITYQDEDTFGPRLHVVLSGYTAPKRIKVPGPARASSGG